MKILIIILLFFSTISFSQNHLNETDRVTSKFKEKLNKNGIDKYFSIKKYCVGSFRINSKKESNFCNTEGGDIYFTTFVFWTENKSSWIKKLDNCGGFEKIKLSDSKAIDFFIQNLEELNSKHVKKYQTENLVKSKKEIYTKSRSHSCFVRFKFHNSKRIVKTHFDEFNLTTDINDPNINFKFNQNLKIIKLSEIIEKIITKFERLNKFNRMN